MHRTPLILAFNSPRLPWVARCRQVDRNRVIWWCYGRKVALRGLVGDCVSCVGARIGLRCGGVREERNCPQPNLIASSRTEALANKLCST